MFLTRGLVYLSVCPPTRFVRQYPTDIGNIWYWRTILLCMTGYTKARTYRNNTVHWMYRNVNLSIINYVPGERNKEKEIRAWLIMSAFLLHIFQTALFTASSKATSTHSCDLVAPLSKLLQFLIFSRSSSTSSSSYSRPLHIPVFHSFNKMFLEGSSCARCDQSVYTFFVSFYLRCSFLT